MKKVNEIVICKDDFSCEEEFQNAIKRAVMVLLENNYIMTIKYDEPGLGIVVIKFDFADESLGSYYPEWLLPDEYESVVWEDDKMEVEARDEPTHFRGYGVMLRYVKDNMSREIVLPDTPYIIPHCGCGEIATVDLTPESLDELIELFKSMKGSD